MSKSLQNALSGDAWSVSAVIFDLNAMLDDEGRPISERRADVLARKGVPMEMQQCPFSGVRQGRWMNVSALTQISQYYKDSLAEMSAFHRRIDGAEATWDDALVCVVDLLAGPALYLLRERNAIGPVPARTAVSHKLAAGMFGVLRKVHERLARGERIPAGTDQLMQIIEETGALVGATLEACAGSMPMIRKAVAALFEGTDDRSIDIDPTRLSIARNLAVQVRLGVFWSLYDEVHLWRLLRGEFREHLAPVNDFLAKKIEQAASALDSAPPRVPEADALPDSMVGGRRREFAAALAGAPPAEVLQGDLDDALALLGEPGSAIGYAGDHLPLARSLAAYLHTVRLFEAELCRVEHSLREALGFDVDAPVRLGDAALPSPRALSWYELIVGRKRGPDGRLTGASTKVRPVAGRSRGV